MIGKATYHVSGLDIRTAENKAITQFKTDYPNIDTEKLIVNSFTLKDYQKIFGITTAIDKMRLSTCALIELEGMKAENIICEYQNQSPAFDQKDFTKLIDKYSLDNP